MLHVLNVNQHWRSLRKSMMSIINEKWFNCFISHYSQTYKIVQQQNANADDINEVIYCHRFCEAHQHEHEHPHQHRLHVPLDLHSELIVLETTECFVIAKEYISSDLIPNELIQCHHCSSNLGSFGMLSLTLSFTKSFIHLF
jgi:hypothetical protein